MTEDVKFDDPRTEVANPRRHGIHLRARLNECIVTLNLTWERAWHGEQFVWGDLFAEDDPFRLQNMTSRLLDLLHPRSRDDREDQLIELMRPRAQLLHLAAVDISGSWASDEPLSELARRIDDDLARLLGRRPTPSGSYQAACIHARRYVVYNNLGHERDANEAMQTAAEARDLALSELSAAFDGAAAIRDWAPKDPAFRHLSNETAFRRLLDPPAETSEPKPSRSL